MGLASKLAASGQQQGGGGVAARFDQTAAPAMVVESAEAAIAATGPSGDVSIAAAGIARIYTDQPYQLAEGSTQHGSSFKQQTYPNYYPAGTPSSSATPVAQDGGRHHSTNHTHIQQTEHYGGQHGSALPTPYESSQHGDSVSQLTPDSSFQASSQVQAVYGSGPSGGDLSCGSAYTPDSYNGSYSGTPSLSVAGSVADVDPEEEVLILQEVTEEEAQRLLAAGQIDQEVDIDDGGATKKHKLSNRFSRSKKSQGGAASAKGPTAPTDPAAAGHGSASHVEHADLVDVIPVLSQMKSAFQLACGDKEGAKKTQSNMTKGCPGISQIRSCVELAKGEKAAAKATQHHQYVAIKTYGGHMPGVGHAMATYHAGQSMFYKGRSNADKAALSKAKAKHELSGSTRTLFVGTAGVAGAAMTAGLDGGATAAALGVSAGVTYDGALTLLSGKRKGYFAVAHKAKRKDMTPGEIFNAALMPVGDALVAGAAEASADKASIGADGQLVGGDAYGVDAPDGSDANTLDAGEQDAAAAVGVLSKLVKPDVADVDPSAAAASATATGAAAAAATGVALSAQAPHPQSHPQQAHAQLQGAPSLAHASMLSVAPSDASSTVFQPLQPAHSLGDLSLGSAPSDASFSLAAHGAPPPPQQQPAAYGYSAHPRQQPPPGWQQPSSGSVPPLHPQPAALQQSSMGAAPLLHPQMPPASMGSAAPPLHPQPLAVQMSGVNTAPPLRQQVPPQQYGMDAAPPLYPQPPASYGTAAPPLYPQPPASYGTAAPPLYPQHPASHGAAAPPLYLQPVASAGSAAPPLPPPQQQLLHDSMQRLSVGSQKPVLQPHAYQNLQHNSMGGGDPNVGIAAAGYGAQPPQAAKPFSIPDGINTAYLKQQAPTGYHGYAPPGAAAPSPYQAKQAQQPYPAQQQYPGQQPQPYGSSQPYPAQQPQPYQAQHQYAGQQAHQYRPAPQQQPSSGGGIAGKLTGMLKSKLNTPF